MFEDAKLIYAPSSLHDAVFCREFDASAGTCAEITVSALGVFEVYINGEKLGDEILAPGWQCYDKRIGAFAYTAENLKEHNVLEIRASHGWHGGSIYSCYKPGFEQTLPVSVIMKMVYTDMGGDESLIVSDESFVGGAYQVVSSDIYDGIIYDANILSDLNPVSVLDYPKDKFFLLDSVKVKEHETVHPIELIRTPKGETVLDFGVNMVGYPILKIDAPKGSRVSLSFAEILDKDGNFYNANYRLAKCRYDYTCRGGGEEFKPFGTFYGYRYVRLDEYPHEYKEGELRSVWVHSDIERCGYVDSSNELLNKLYENIIRGQRGNYLDIPTDCPQRNERLGWCGDAQVFIKAAIYNFDVLEFFRKWLQDLILSRGEKKVIPRIAPLTNGYKNWQNFEPTAAWSDAITICPFELYLAYGDKSILEETFEAMRDHVESMRRRAGDSHLWTGDDQFGDWLGLDAPFGSLKGSSNEDIIATAFYARSTELLVKSGEILSRDVSEYRALYARIRESFISAYEDKLATQTECALALHFDLVDNREEIHRRLVSKIRACGHLETGFVGTPYLLHALSAGGDDELAYELLLREEYPSWLYPVTMGATTIWEHWDGLRPDGVLWSDTMNSYNHYAYGACADWIFSRAAGIMPHPDFPGYGKAKIAPHPSPRLGHLTVRYKTRNGDIVSSWRYVGDRVEYDITVPTPATVVIDGREHEVETGTYHF
ncbi:MAG: family 78 glycoside hydrolase catalytic domain [Clostridia bacterium]|nr:family 78 glycoside hydrolase catalytic domain [Clostridia bacterium]